MSGFDTILTTEQKQTMKLSPAQLQTIEILQLSAVQLEERISTELLENPVLEIDEHQQSERPVEKATVELNSDIIGNDAADRYDDRDYWEHDMSYSGSGSSGISDYEKFYRAEETLTSHLMMQLHAVSCPDNVRRACRFVIYSLDDNGFLDLSPEELEAASENTAEEFVLAIPIVQAMDPAGVAARNMAECLRLQLDPEDELSSDAALVIERLEEIASGNLRRVARDLCLSQERLMQIIGKIRTLDPKPGARFSDGAAVRYAVPDVIADYDGTSAHIYIAGDIPALQISSYYSDLASSTEDPEVGSYLKERIDAASRLIRNIEQRNQTIVNVTRVILEHQSQFLQTGASVLKPLTMQEVADSLGIHISTVSRAVSEKYLKCPGGTFALRHFFTAEVSGGTRDSILSRIRELIAAEDPAHPLSDQKITDILVSEKIEISRRAVAKYRDADGIPSASQRRKRF